MLLFSKKKAVWLEKKRCKSAKQKSSINWFYSSFQKKLVDVVDMVDLVDRKNGPLDTTANVIIWRHVGRAIWSIWKLQPWISFDLWMRKIEASR